RSGPQLRTAWRVVGQDGDGLRHSLRIARRYAERIHAVVEELRGSARRADDHRPTAGHGFDDRQPEGLRARARVDDDVEGAIDVLDPLLEGDEGDVLLD